MTRLFIENLEAYGYHGASSEEQTVGHRYVVTVSLLIDEQACDSDRVEDTVDYGDVAEVILHQIREHQCATMERLAAIVGQTLLLRYPRVRRLDLRLAKRLPPIPDVAESAGVEISMERH